jgi:hypothetical protein
MRDKRFIDNKTTTCSMINSNKYGNEKPLIQA